jgi:hypothetical protein
VLRSVASANIPLLLFLLKFTAGGNLFARPTVQKIFLFYWARVVASRVQSSRPLFRLFLNPNLLASFFYCAVVHTSRELNYLLPVNSTPSAGGASFVSTSQHLCAAAEYNPHTTNSLALCKVRLCNSFQTWIGGALTGAIEYFKSRYEKKKPPCLMFTGPGRWRNVYT